jgi:hypothetical protein
MVKTGERSKNKRKGSILEDVVALLHDDPDVVVQKRVQLPTITHPERTREVDVLITGMMLGRQMKMAIECKNYGTKIGVPKIDEFRGKLEEVGIPVQYGIFVTATDFTIDARQRAKALGMRLRRLEGLTGERLSAEVHAAFQSIVYLLARVSAVNIVSDAAEASPMELMFLRNAEGVFVGGVPDLIWAQWRDGKIPTTLGDHHLSIRIPADWQWIIGGVHSDTKAEATVTVEGVVATLTGEANRFVLRDADSNEIERARVTAVFDSHPDGKVTMPVETAHSEAELQHLLNRPAVARTQIGRIPLPRILYNGNLFWPPSLRVSLELRQRALELERQGKWEPGVLSTLTLAEVEGTDLSAMWEPITPEHPAAHDPHWPWPKKQTRGRRSRPSANPARRIGARSS